MINFYSILKEFEEHLMLRNLTKLTIRHHLSRLKQFSCFLNEYSLSDIAEITTKHLQEYQKYRYYKLNIYYRQDCINVQNHHLSTIKIFFNFLKVNDFILKDPSIKIQPAKNPTRLPKDALTNHEMKKLLSKPNKNTVLGYRDQTILELLYTTGIRNAELINLKLRDVDYTEGYLRVNQGKGGKDRVVPIGKIACYYLENYIKGIRPLFYRVNELDVLFISKKGRPLSANGLYLRILYYAQQCEIDKHITPHTFRRSCATEMIKNNANPMHVKELLGHSSMVAIQSYCNLSIVDLKAAHKKCHPREKEAK